MKNVDKGTFAYTVVSTILLLLYGKLFKGKKEAVLKSETFADELFLPMYKQFVSIFSNALIFMKLGADFDTAMEAAQMLSNFPHETSENNINPEDHNCDSCPNKGDCSVEDMMRDLNKQSVVPDEELYEKLKEMLHLFKN